MRMTEVEFAGAAGPLFEQESAKLWRSLFLHTGDREAASDAVAEAFAQLIRRGSDVKDPRAWVWRSAFRIADRDEAARRHVAVAAETPSYELPEAVVDLVRALRQLPTSQRGAVVLHHMLDLPVAEVALILGTSRSAVTVHLHRGRRRLREILGDEDG
jgi:RNA polymerase sigma-70 factor (ECF subfamily)